VWVSGNQLTYASVRRDLDLYALWKFDARHQLRVSTANLLGQDTVSASSYAVAASGTEASCTTTATHPSVRATLEVKF